MVQFGEQQKELCYCGVRSIHLLKISAHNEAGGGGGGSGGGGGAVIGVLRIRGL